MRLALPTTLATAVLLAACASPMGSAPAAVAKLEPTNGNLANGEVRFTPTGGKVLVSGEIRGLKPGGEHGFHIHDKGDCSSGDGMSAGGHFNPGASAHGQHGAGPSHAGDLQSLKADASGVAKFQFDSTALGIGSGPGDIVGRGLIVHRDPDDYKTQPTGNSGPRLACAVITKA